MASESESSSDGTYAVKAHTTYPLTLDVCGRQMEIKESPKRVVSIQLSTLPTMVDLGLEDRVAGVVQKIYDNTYPADMEAKLKAMPALNFAQGDGGSVQVGMETILSANADMVFGLEKDLDYAALEASKIPSYTQAGNCKDATSYKAQLSDIHALYDEVATIFDVPEAAAKAKAALDKRIEAVQGKQVKDAGTAAILYITPGETAIWTYGTASMANVIMKESGLTNIYADRPERVFEVSAEDVLAKDPDYVVLVNIGYAKDETIEALKGLGSLNTLKALKEDKVTVMPYAWTDPASSLVVDGIETVSEFVKSRQ